MLAEISSSLRSPETLQRQVWGFLNKCLASNAKDPNAPEAYLSTNGQADRITFNKIQREDVEIIVSEFDENKLVIKVAMKGFQFNYSLTGKDYNLAIAPLVKIYGPGLFELLETVDEKNRGPLAIPADTLQELEESIYQVCLTKRAVFDKHVAKLKQEKEWESPLSGVLIDG